MSGASGSRDARATASIPGCARRCSRTVPERRGALRVVAVHPEIEGDRRDRLGIEAEVRALSRQQTAHHQRPGNEQHERRRELRDDEGVAEEGAPAIGPLARGVGLERGHQVRSRGRPRGGHAEQDRRREGREDGESQHGGVDVIRELERDGQRVCLHAGQDHSRPVGDSQPQAAAESGEDEALGEQLAQQASAAGSDGRAHRELPAPRRAASQHHVRDVGAGDGQDEPDRDQ